MHLYYTGEENGNPMITYPYTRTAIEGTVAAFDDTVHKILRKDFKHRCDDAKTCKKHLCFHDCHYTQGIS